MHRLTYVRQVLDETLRLWPTAPGFTRYALRGHRDRRPVPLPAGTAITVLTPALHRDHVGLGCRRGGVQPRPHRARSGWPRCPPNAYKPFGTGQRACIGRQFALQEADPGARACCCSASTSSTTSTTSCKIKTTLTVKPDELRIQVRPRPGRQLDRRPPTRSPSGRARLADGRGRAPAPRADRHGTPLPVLFGSNLGTAEAIATRLAQEAPNAASTSPSGPLDDHVDDLPPSGALLVVCASYNGTPPDNAAAFCRWLSDAPADAAPGVAYTVFGCGNTEWASTYQAVPDAASTSSSAAHGGRADPLRAARATPPATSTPPTAPGTAGCGPTSRARSGCPPEVAAGARRPGPRLVDHADQPAGHQPGDHVLRGAARRLVRANRELIPATTGSRRSGPRATSRSRCPAGATLPGRATTSGCCRATGSTPSAG